MILWFLRKKILNGAAGICFQAPIVLENLETKKIVLVHGEGFGAWCWYKTISLLEDSGFKVNAIDLTGSGIHSYNTNKISSLSEYAEPLTSYLKGLGGAEKVSSLSIYQF